MLTKEDLRQIGEVVDERLDVKLEEKLKPFREDVKSDFRYLAQEITRLDVKIDGSEERLGKKIDKAMDHVDGFTKKQLDFDSELASHRSTLERLGGFPAAT